MANQAKEPDLVALGVTLGKTKRHWDALVAHLDGLAGVRREWKLYGGAHGWQLKARDQRAALLYLIPRAGSFIAALPLNREAVQALPRCGLPAAVVAAILADRPAREGHPARIEVKTREDVEHVEALLALCLASRRPSAAASARPAPPRSSSKPRG